MMCSRCEGSAGRTRRVEVLHGIDFEAAAGEVIAIAGANGARQVDG